ncbi:4'-phosphopantetheinyl transferase superfamily protein [Desulfobulbus sp.]|uniref:4'-phosphopantetheinyl transferase superfamily protein n=1 Tax=Desulfobulbus sp. TaxID=895 RepID=UPI0027B8DD65|nr:4'-phosphopantetheinyl transferase superfamily protein [Desulfobulbus sp.]
MAKTCQGITVHAASFAHQRSPAFYAALSDEGKTGEGWGTNKAADRIRLAALLWEHVAARENPPWQYRSLCAAFPLQVAHGPLGRPHLLLGGVRGPSLSFSEGDGKTWAALSGDASDIGIDVAAADQFQGKYPLHRVFHDQELHHALRLTGGDVTQASALLWSVKEAVVKALGCGFHLVAPLQVHVSPPVAGDRGFTFPVYLSGKALLRYPMAAGRSIRVRSFPRGKMWLAIALLSGHSRCGKDEDVQINALPRQNVDS